MKRELRITEDGSHTLYVNDLDESYHSIHGAIQESVHVFINQGFRKISQSYVRVLEIGFGTGLNMILTLRESERTGIRVNYHAVENYPLTPEEYKKLNYDHMKEVNSKGLLTRAHDSQWDTSIKLTDSFTLYKELSDFRTMGPRGPFDLVYFDAFAPDKQPHIWSAEIFSKIHNVTVPGGVLVSYTSRGSIRRIIKTCGFKVEKVPGPPGKWEMIRATRI